MKLNNELNKAWEEYCKLSAEGCKHWVEAYKLDAKGRKLYAEADLIWAKAVIKARGEGTTIEWEGADKCTLGTGEVFEKEARK